MDAAWNRILGNVVDPASESQLKELFHDTECLEKREFSVLHKTVLQLVSLDLESLLQASTSTLNIVDSNGRTALSWAAARGDEKAVETLLKYRAHPDISNVSGMTPLHYAARAKTPTCARLLAKVGADVNFLTDVLQSPLHHAAAYQDDKGYLECLVDAGANLDAPDGGGYSPLTWTTFSNHAISAAYLLERGANIENCDKDHRTALLHAIESNSHDVLQLLLRQGASYASIDTEFCTILHFLAEYGDIQTIELFSATSADELDVDVKNDKGLTASDVMRGRTDTSHERHTAFEALIARLREKKYPSEFSQIDRREGEEEEDAIDYVDIFEDALEFPGEVTAFSDEI